MKDNDLTLENKLSFILYVCSKETIRRYQIYLEKLNLTYTQYSVLLILWNGDNIPVNELGQKLNSDTGKLTPMLKKLETKNLLKRVRDTVDGKNVMVTLTQEGRELNEKVKDIPQTIFDETGIPKEEANEMITKLNDILKRVK